MAAEAPTIRIIDFYTTFDQLIPKKGDVLNDNVDDKGYILDAKGKRVMEREATDWVVYAPAHSPVNTRNIERVKFLKPLEHGDPDSAGYQLQVARWKQIEPGYEAWKKGQDIPLNGTPLAVWAGIRPEQIKVIQQFGIKTVEEVEMLSESQIERIRLPNMRDLKVQARAFLANMGASVAAEQQAKMQESMDAMAERMAQMEDALKRANAANDALRDKRPADDEVAALKAELDARGVEYDGRWAAPKLRSLLVETEKAA